MKNPLARYAAGALALGAVAGGVAGLHAPGPGWQPVTYGLHETPAQLLPANVSTDHPVRVVSTSLDAQGRPVVTVRTATSKAAAAQLVTRGQKAANAVGVELDAVATASDVLTGTDPYRGSQWDLGKMGAGDAWLKSTGAGVTVAVLDTGVDASHPDLAGQLLPGYDVMAGTTGVTTDPAGHGTHVAGTIAALTGNGVGVGSVAPNAKIMPIRVLGAGGSGYMSDTATGIVYAADHGANVINMSLGATVQVTAVTNAIAYARSKGVVVVAAAGNSRASGSPTSYPGADPGVIGVAATDSNDVVANFSNQGSYVDVAAPGTDIASTYPVALGGYMYMSGTSMASPHVAAEAALIKAYRPALTPDQIEQAIESTAVDLGTKGKDNDYGYGRVNAAAALTAAEAMSPAPSTSTPGTSTPGTSTPSTSAPSTSAPGTSAPTAAPTLTVSPAPSTTTSPAPAKSTVAPTPAPSLTTVAPTPAPSRTTVAPVPSKTTVAPAPAPTRTTTAPKVHPAITVSPLTQSVVAGATATTTFTVTAAGKPWAQQPVQICLAPLGAPFTCTRATTGGNGSIQVGVQATGAFQLNLVASATDTSEAVTSATANVSVRSSLTLTRTGPGTLSAALAGVAGQTVQVQRLDRNGWVGVSTYRAEATHALTGLVSGQTYRVVVPGTTAVVGVTSASVQA